MLKQWLIVIGFVLAMLFCNIDCSNKMIDMPSNKVDTILVHRVDTINKLDTILQTKIKWIDTSKITIVHDTFNAWIKPIGPETTYIADNQLRACLACHDSLETYKQINKIDSITIDTLNKVVHNIEPEKHNWEYTAKTLGIGILVGAGLLIWTK